MSNENKKRVIMQVRIFLLEDGQVVVTGFDPTIQGVCTANLMLDRAKDDIKAIPFEIPKSSINEFPPGSSPN